MVLSMLKALMIFRAARSLSHKMPWLSHEAKAGSTYDGPVIVPGRRPDVVEVDWDGRSHETPQTKQRPC